MFSLPELGYAYDALEPHIDAKTMEIHHSKHHAAYIAKLNEAIAKNPALESKTLEDLLTDLDSTPEAVRLVVRNNAGGHYNHSLFWQLMKPGGSNQPLGEVAKIIEKNFGGYEKFKQQFNEVAVGRFGSGWAWLVKTEDKYLITSTPNQDNPLMDGHIPLLGLDVWEHAYYLKYQNRRPEYIEAWWQVMNWDVVAKNLSDQS